MSMKIRLKNIGILKQAKFSLGDLTLICGENNTGKTYAACALYGFLNSWRKFIRFPISNAQIQRALTEPVKIDLAQATDDMLTEACKSILNNWIKFLQHLKARSRIVNFTSCQMRLTYEIKNSTAYSQTSKILLLYLQRIKGAKK